MPLELATSLLLRNADDGSPADEGAVYGVVADWVEVEVNQLASCQGLPGRNGGAVSGTEILLQDGRKRWQLTHTVPDSDDASVEWQTELTAIFEPDATSIVVQLHRRSLDHRLRPLSGYPAVPGVVRRLLDAGHLESVDGAAALSPRYRVVDAGDVPGIVALWLLGEDRRLPVIGIAPRQGVPLVRDARRLAQRVAGVAHVLTFRPDALRPLWEEVDELSLGRGCVRVWWPGMNLDDDPASHPQFDSGDVQVELERMMLRVARDRWREPARVRRFGQALREQRDASADQAAERVAKQLDELRAVAAAAKENSGQSEMLELMADDLDGVRTQLKRVEDERDYNETQWLEAQEASEALERQLFVLRARVDALSAQVADGASVAGHAPVSPEDIFMAEIAACWDDKLADGDRSSYPLGGYCLGPGFLASIEKAGASRTKVVETVMQVTCGLAQSLSGREVHALREGSGGGDPPRKRAVDGASAMRCAIQRGTPSARRLHYWVLPGGGFEFANVVKHDDMRIV